MEEKNINKSNNALNANISSTIIRPRNIAIVMILVSAFIISSYIFF